MLDEALTLIWWVHNCCISARDDGKDETHKWLREDASTAERTMRRFIETEDRDLARFAKRAKLKRAA